MKQLKQTFERTKHHTINKTINGLSISRFHNFQQPRRELIPEQFVNQHQCFAQTIFRKQIGNFNRSCIQSLVEPLNSQMSLGWNWNGTFAISPSFNQTESIPYLVAEVTSLFAKGVVEKNIVSGRSRKHHTHTHTVGTILFDQFQWIGRVTERFRHLTSLFITNDSCEVYVLKRHLSLVFVACHNHTGYPEEDNVRSCHKVACRIVVFDFFVARVVDSVEQRDRPQPRREPSVQAIFILTKVFHCQGGITRLFFCFCQSFLGSSGYYITTFRQEVCRNTMSPPQLTADTPVFDVFHPVTVGILVFCRVEFQIVVHYRRQCHICEMLHLEEPLHRQFRFDHNVGTFRISYLISIGFYFFEQSGSFEVLLDLLTNIETVHADIHTGSFAQCTVVIENIDTRQVVFFTQHIVVYIMGRGYFQTTRTEFDVYIIILNHRNDTVYQRNDHFLSFQPFVLRVVRIDTHSRITHNCFRTGCCNNRVATFRITFYFIAEVIQFSVFFLIDYFFVRKGSQGFRVPVYHANAPVDQSFIEQIDKYLDYTFATFLIHSESSTIPVAGCAEFTELFQDNTTVLVCPFPGMFQEFVTR